MFKEIAIESLSFNPFTKIGEEWMLITAGDEMKYNTMTASWGGMGFMWAKNIVNVYVRPHRYTYEFMESNDYFTLAFFDEKYRDGLMICGTKSGRDGDKVAEAGLTPYFLEGTTAFAEANMIFICKKHYRQEMKGECFTVKETDVKHYPIKDYHVMYMGEVVKVLMK